MNATVGDVINISHNIVTEIALPRVFCTSTGYE